MLNCACDRPARRKAGVRKNEAASEPPRSESLLLDNRACDQIVHGELALDENGKFLAIRSAAYQALGACWWGAATAPLFWRRRRTPTTPDGDVWFTENFANRIGRMDSNGPDRPVGFRMPASRASRIVATSDVRVLFRECDVGMIDEIIFP
jgi:hypothetical protein